MVLLVSLENDFLLGCVIFVWFSDLAIRLKLWRRSENFRAEVFGSDLCLKELFFYLLGFLYGFFSLLQLNVSDEFFEHGHLLFLVWGWVCDRLVGEISSKRIMLGGFKGLRLGRVLFQRHICWIFHVMVWNWFIFLGWNRNRISRPWITLTLSINSRELYK